MHVGVARGCICLYAAAAAATTTSSGFCLSGLFFQNALQVMITPQKVSQRRAFGTDGAIVL